MTTYNLALFYDDTKLNRYIGHEVKCEGFLVGTTLLAEQIKVVN